MTASRLAEYAARAELTLRHWLPSESTPPTRLHQAMRYAVLNGGKRLRPALVYAAGEVAGAAPEALDGAACAVELIHSYSLVHDDLPAMDDDALRRGKPTCHIAFDEATAILAGDALQSLAFTVLAEEPTLAVPAARRLEMIAVLAAAGGAAGMVGGQVMDMEGTGRDLDLPALETMHRCKTGALIAASVRLGTLAAPAVDEEMLQRLERYAAHIGLAFQIRDDILDVEGETETLGKPQGSDAAGGKATYTRLLGLDAARKRLLDLHAAARETLHPFGNGASSLEEIADFIIQRIY